ncbi:hypothetical protein L6452_08672 [Arctium lappa]|uniref:Uncharacterized protein n=1 Tax=Arctium lappa TaxID=4217 RepID=A0ACB9DID2_ARCLA|nr:hypothetical protein L6452_08672 [Arctium lappa]
MNRNNIRQLVHLNIYQIIEQPRNRDWSDFYEILLFIHIILSIFIIPTLPHSSPNRHLTESFVRISITSPPPRYDSPVATTPDVRHSTNALGNCEWRINSPICKLFWWTKMGMVMMRKVIRQEFQLQILIIQLRII